MLNFFKNLTGSNANEMKAIVASGAAIVDVRTPAEFAGGHAKGAINIPLDTIDNQMGALKKYKKGIVLCCASGMRSARAKGVLLNKGIQQVEDAGAWTNLN